MIIGLLAPSHLSVGVADILSFLPLGHSSLTRAVLAIISHWSWWAIGPIPALFGPALGDPGRPLVLCPRSLPVLWVAILVRWLVWAVPMSSMGFVKVI